MRNLAVRAALLLVLTLALVPPAKTVTAQTDTRKVRLFDPSQRMRAVNLQRLNKLGEGRFNKAVIAYNEQMKKPPAEIDADKLAEALAEMALAANEMFPIALHLDESEP